MDITDASSGISYSSPSSETDIQVLVVGFGKMGLLHGGLLQAHPDTTVCGVVDPSLSSRFLSKSLSPRVPSYKNIDIALEDLEDVDACVVSSPPSAHRHGIYAAIQAGIHLFVEKPLTTDPAESKKLARLAANNGLRGLVGYVRRFHPTFRRFQESIKGRSDVKGISLRILSPQFVESNGRSGENRGGVHWDLLPHAADMLFWINDEWEQMPHLDTCRSDGMNWIEVQGHMNGRNFDLRADWTAQDVRSVGMEVTTTFEDGTQLQADEYQVKSFDRENRQRETVFHVREHPPPWFDIAGPEFSLQTQGWIDEILQLSSGGTTLEEAARIDRFIAESLAQSVNPR